MSHGTPEWRGAGWAPGEVTQECTPHTQSQVGKDSSNTLQPHGLLGPIVGTV